MKRDKKTNLFFLAQGTQVLFQAFHFSFQLINLKIVITVK